MRDLRNFADEAVYRRNTGETNTLQIHDGTAGLKELARLSRASWKTRVGELLVFDNEILEHSVHRCDLVHGSQVDLSELFDVDRAAVLDWRGTMSFCKSSSGESKAVHETHTLSVL